MTKKELSQYYWLNMEIEADKERLAILNARATAPQSPQLTGMPHGSGGQDKIGNLAAEIVDLSTILEEKLIKSLMLRQDIEKFIMGIEDSMTRMVFTYRCIDGMSWKEVAESMGQYMTEDNAKQIFHRYFKKSRRSK